MEWRDIGDFRLDDRGEFFGAESWRSARKRGGVKLRRSQKFTAHDFEQYIGSCWHPALITPKLWKR